MCIYQDYFMKRQRGKFPEDLYWENKTITYKLKRSIGLIALEL